VCETQVRVRGAGTHWRTGANVAATSLMADGHWAGAHRHSAHHSTQRHTQHNKQGAKTKSAGAGWWRSGLGERGARGEAASERLDEQQASESE
jgi:hypothetical protein